MEKKLNKKFEDYITCFKNGVRDKINSMKFEEKDKINELMGFVYDYERLIFQKDDISKQIKKEKKKSLIHHLKSASLLLASLSAISYLYNNTSNLTDNELVSYTAETLGKNIFGESIRGNPMISKAPSQSLFKVSPNFYIEESEPIHDSSKFVGKTKIEFNNSDSSLPYYHPLPKTERQITLTTLATPINPISKYAIDGYKEIHALEDYWDSSNWKVKDPKDYCIVHNDTNVF